MTSSFAQLMALTWRAGGVCVVDGGQKVRQSLKAMRDRGVGTVSGDTKPVMNCDVTWLATVLSARLGKRSRVAKELPPWATYTISRLKLPVVEAGVADTAKFGG